MPYIVSLNKLQMYRSFLLFLIFSFCMVTLADGQQNAAIYGSAKQSSLFERGFAANAIDDNTDGRWGQGSVTHTQDENNAWWEVDLGSSFEIENINLWNRTDCCADRLRSFYVFVSDTPIAADADPEDLENELWNVFRQNFFEGNLQIPVGQTGRYVRVQQNDRRSLVLSLAEVQVNIVNSTKDFQRIDIPEITKQRSDARIELPETTSAGLPISYSVVSGPGTINGNELSFTGGGTVTIEGSQAGNDDYFPAASKQASVLVIEPSTVAPQLTRHNFSEEYDFSMNSLEPIELWASFGIDHPELFWVSERSISVDGVDLTVDKLRGEGTRAIWTPDGYGTYTIEVKATADHGTQLTESFTINVTDDNPFVEVTALDKAEVVWPRAPYNAIQTAILPSFKGQYNKITGFLDITCPDEGCDPFDRIGQFFVKTPEGNWVEIFRYITPFGIECSHEVDLTDMASLLQGKTEFRFYVETFSNGWQATLRLEYEAGQPEYDYSRIVPVWEGRFPFGDLANLQPVPVVEYESAPNAVTANMRMYTSGHGWGDNNTLNAAEFLRVRHDIMVNEESAYEQDLWDFCNPNPDGCNNQLGTWQFDRAGWCPGAIGKKYVYNLDNWADAKARLHYRFFRGYRDLCHPNNDRCVTGLTCLNCDDGFNPFYVVHAYIVEQGDEIIVGGNLVSNEQVNELVSLSVSPNPSMGMFTIEMPENDKIEQGVVRNAQGQFIQRIYPNDNSTLQIDLSDAPSGMYLLELSGERKHYSAKLVKR